jgi:chemotaxis protein MotA
MPVDFATIIGLAGGTILVVIVMALSGSLMMYWDFLSVLIVMGGAIFSTIIRWSMGKFIRGMTAGLKSMMSDVDDPSELIVLVIDLANKARKESILSLEKVEIKNEFLAKAVKYMVDGLDEDSINDILQTDITSLKKRHLDGRQVYMDLGESAPAWGMIGTVIGLVVIMANLTDPSKIGPGLAVALITTLYGALAANLFFVPIAKKLKYRSEQEVQNLNIIRAGVSAILKGENPRTIQEKLEMCIAS